MEKFSVKKPFTVLVAVIMVIMLGLVSVQNMQTNLLPNVNTPYLMVVTVYPGASPERVENEVSDVMESALGTISGVKNVTATSAENYSLLLMEFEDDTDMNSAVVKVSNKVDQTTSSLPSTCMTPSIIEYTLNMNAFMTVAVSREGSDSYELADFVNDTMVPYIERQGGVSNISANGLVTRMVQVQLDQEKIDAINEKLLEVIDVQLADAKAQLDDAEAQIEAGRKEYETQLANYDKLVSDTINSQYSGELQDSFMLVKKQAQALLESVNQLIAVVNEPEIQQALIDVRDGLQRVVDKFNETGMQDIDSLIEIVAELRDITDKLTTALQDLQQRLNAQGDTAGTTAGELVDDLQVQQSLSNIYNTLESTIKAMDDVPGLMDQFTQIVGTYSQQQLQAYIKFTEAREMLNNYEQQLADAKQQYEDAKQKAMENSDVAKMLDINTLAQLIYAQNFSMPAGYVKDSSNKSWLLKVGEEYDSIEDISGALLLHVDGFGDVRLSDVADVQIIDNAEDSFTRLNGERSVVLKIFKSNSSSAGEVSGNCKAAFKELEQKYDGLHVVVLSNQGNYISIIVSSILSSMLIGAALAIIVLAIFLKDIKPTLVVGISIPLSVLFAVVLMYFTGLDMNIMTLAGLSLGIGMLVDNSIVVIENIYRLRSRGVPAARAAVQGTKQVGMAIMASTLTSVCVFLPVIFTSGVIKSLLQPMSMCIGYCLAASLIVALTVAPAASSTLLKNSKPKELKWFDKVQEKYVKSLEWCFQHRWAPLGAAVVLLVFCGWRVMSMGVEMLPTITSNEAIVTLSTEKDMTKEESYAVAENVIDALLAVDNVEEVGVTTDSRVAGMDVGQLGLPQTITDLLNAANSYGTYQINVMLDESLSSRQIEQAREALEEAVNGVENCTATVEISGMQELTSQLDMGLTVQVSGNDIDTMTALSEKVVDMVNEMDGFTNATNGLGSGDATINLQIDRDKVRSYGLTVAQVYQQIAAKLTTDTTATTLKAGGTSYTVTIVDKTDTPTLDDIFNMEFETTTTDEDGNTVKETHTLGEFATRTTTAGYTEISRENGSRQLSITSETAEGYNTTLISRELEPKLAELQLPDGVTAELAGETTQVTEMLDQMAKMLALALLFVYFVMVAQFQSLLSPFIVLFTIPLAFTGGMLGLMATGEQLSLISLMGFLVLMGVVVNNGIVFVDYANQLRIGGLERSDALVATGRTRMRPILMTTLTTVLAMVTMLFGTDMASEMSTGMAIVIIGGLSYATLMTLFIVPVLYDLFYRKPPVNIDVGDDGMDDLPDDAAEFAAEFAARRAAENAAEAPAEEKRRPDLSRAAHAPAENETPNEEKEADHDAE